MSPLPRLRQRLANPSLTLAQMLCAIGCAAAGHAMAGPIDCALYLAKSEGRNRTMVASGGTEPV